MLLRKMLPEHHLSGDTKDTVKVAMGLVATMVALVLGLLIAAATAKYDKESAGVTQMAAKVIYLDRMLANYGPEANDVREQLRERLADRFVVVDDRYHLFLHQAMVWPLPPVVARRRMNSRCSCVSKRMRAAAWPRLLDLGISSRDTASHFPEARATCTKVQ